MAETEAAKQAAKPLSEMTLDELWHLFPISLTPHRPEWAEWFAQEQTLLCELLPQADTVRISHIGSTAVPSVMAKPIVDILVEVRADCPLETFREPLTRAGYLCMSERTEQLSWNKGYTPQGYAERVFHLHLRHEGAHDELYFRDWLRLCPEAAKEYEALKLRLAEAYRYNRDGYTAAKAAFITEQTRRAKQALGENCAFATNKPEASFSKRSVPTP